MQKTEPTWSAERVEAEAEKPVDKGLMVKIICNKGNPDPENPETLNVKKIITDQFGFVLAAYDTVDEDEFPDMDVIPLDIELPMFQICLKYAEWLIDNKATEIKKPIMTKEFNELSSEFERGLITDLSQADLFTLINTCNYLQFTAMQDLASARVAVWVKNMSIEECRALFGLENDFTPEEEEQFKKESAPFEESK